MTYSNNILDDFRFHEESLTSPADNFFAITPSDNNLEHIPRGIFIGIGGKLIITGMDNNQVELTVYDGQILPIRPLQINAGSTALNIIGLY